ncbi:kin of IRRE-like protein 3 [Glandiceps talaboti]
MGGIFRLAAGVLLLFVLKSTNAVPTVVVTPSSLTTVAEETVMFTCTVTNKEDFSLFWIIHLNSSNDDIVLAPTNSHTGYPRYSFTGDASNGESTLQIANVVDEDAGLYKCMVTSPDNDATKIVVTSSVLTVGIVESPSSGLLVSKSANLDFATMSGDSSKGGETATLSCTVTGGQPSATLEWFRNGVKIPEQDYSVENGVAEAKVEWTLSYLDSHANYTCRGDHPAWQDTHEFTYVDLNLFFSPVVSLSPSLMLVDVDQDATFRCSAMARPEASTYTWYYNGEEITSDSTRFNVTSSGKVLVITGVTNNDYDSEVTCEATNTEGTNNMTSIIMEPSKLKDRDLELRYLLAIIVGIVGVIFLLAIIISCCVCCSNTRKERRKNDPTRRDSYTLSERDGINYDHFQGGAETRGDGQLNGGASNPAMTTENAPANIKAENELQVEASSDPMYATVNKKGSIRSGSSSVEDNNHLSDTDTVPVTAHDEVDSGENQSGEQENQSGGHVLY